MNFPHYLKFYGSPKNTGLEKVALTFQQTEADAIIIALLNLHRLPFLRADFAKNYFEGYHKICDNVKFSE